MLSCVWLILQFWKCVASSERSFVASTPNRLFGQDDDPLVLSALTVGLRSSNKTSNAHVNFT